MTTYRFERQNIIAEFGQWCVTSHGLENLIGPVDYDLHRGLLGEPWLRAQVASKDWVNMADFDEALRFARQHWRIAVEDEEPASAICPSGNRGGDAVRMGDVCAEIVKALLIDEPTRGPAEWGSGSDRGQPGKTAATTKRESREYSAQC